MPLAVMQRPAVTAAATSGSPGWLPLAAALISVCLWASAFVGIRAAGHAFSPGALGLGRLVTGTLVLGVLSLTQAGVRPSRSEILLLLTAGLLWLGLYNIVLNEAERRVDAARPQCSSTLRRS